MIGTMTAYLNHRDSIADIGILIGDASAQGKGVGTIAWRIAMEYLFRAQHIRKLTAGTISEHTAMIRIFERNHMKQEGCLRSHQVLNERVFDVVLYGILREEWP